MLSAVKSRPNYYEMLGLTPDAAGGAIAQAFATATSVFRPHAFGGITELCMAYETLRDPIKRRAYDASLGLTPKPMRVAVSRPATAHFMVRPTVDLTPPPPEPKVEPRPPEPVPQPLQAPETSTENRPISFSFNERPDDVGYSPVDWKKTGTIVGGLAGAAIVIGALAGWWSGSSAAEPEQASAAAAKSSSAAEKAAPSFAELWTDPNPPVVDARAEGPRREARVRRAAQRRQFAPSEAEADLIQPPEDLVDPPAADPLAPEAVAAPAVAAQMPLPHGTVARTIDRIGYSCGSVASATAIEGAGGVYKVTCTSGQSFQAKPVNGRYRFRRLAGS